MNCVGVLKQGNGECPSLTRSCEFCSDVFLPACGDDGTTYRNLCELKCNNADFRNFGICVKEEENPFKGDCSVCSNEGNGICGTDGFNYRNECQCTCKGNCKKYSEGRCPVDRFCTEQCAGLLDYVCASNGQAFDNTCYLRCAGLKTQHMGRC